MELLNGGLLPRHAFPIDLVALWTARDVTQADQSEVAIQRDLAIALSEYAPGAEVVRKKRIFRAVGVYDPFDRTPNYVATQQFVECANCRAVQVLPLAAAIPPVCLVCQQATLRGVPFLRPLGFSSDWDAEPDGRPYYGGGRDRMGYATPATLTVGQDALQEPPSALSPRLHTLIRVGDLYTMNFARTATAQGFRICPQCGRALDDQTTSHTYPADVPPHQGARRGPRAGARCPNTNPGRLRLALGHRFPSEVILMSVVLPPGLEADPSTASGRAAWLSFGTLLTNAATAVLDIDPEELRIGVRPVIGSDGRLQGEIYIHDTLPGGAGYARDINENLQEVFTEALALSRQCSNPDCSGACYSCLLDYRNQHEHPLLDRGLGCALLEWVLHGTTPSLPEPEMDAAVQPLREFVAATHAVLPPRYVGSQYLPLVYQHPTRGQVAVIPVHTLATPPSRQDLQPLSAAGIESHAHKSFDLTRRPFWVWRRL